MTTQPTQPTQPTTPNDLRASSDEIARNLASIEAVPRTYLPDGKAREHLVAHCRDGRDIYCYRGANLEDTLLRKLLPPGDELLQAPPRWNVWLNHVRIAIEDYVRCFEPGVCPHCGSVGIQINSDACGSIFCTYCGWGSEEGPHPREQWGLLLGDEGAPPDEDEEEPEPPMAVPTLDHARHAVERVMDALVFESDAPIADPALTDAYGLDVLSRHEGDVREALTAFLAAAEHYAGRDARADMGLTIIRAALAGTAIPTVL